MAKEDSGNMGTMAAVTAAAIATAAGAYWLYGSEDASKNRKTVKSWMLKARAEVMDAVEKAQDIDKEKYLRIVGDVVKNYSAVAGAQSKEIQQLVSDLKNSWRYMQQQRQPATSRVKAVKQSASRVAKKVIKKRR